MDEFQIVYCSLIGDFSPSSGFGASGMPEVDFKKDGVDGLGRALEISTPSLKFRVSGMPERDFERDGVDGIEEDDCGIDTIVEILGFWHAREGF